MKEDITIIIPARNCKDFIDDCMKSIFILAFWSMTLKSKMLKTSK
jgi:hypothetical protein